MPNLPLKVSRGLQAGINQKRSQKRITVYKEIISAWGREFEVKKEEMLNGVTALSGSGPAYFYLLAELMEETARSFGLNKKYSDLIARETFIGAAKLLDSSALPIEKLRESITSKGGTTAAAINSFLENNFAGVVKNGIIKAQKGRKNYPNKMSENAPTFKEKVYAVVREIPKRPRFDLQTGG